MAALVTSQVVHVREDLADVIKNIDPDETPVYSMLAKTTATNNRHEFMTEVLSAPNPNNAFVENAEFEDSTLTKPERLANYTQISQKVVNVSGSLQAFNTAGSQNEFVRQVKKAGVELRRDIEVTIVGNGASVASSGPTAGRSAGMESWIKTNVSHGATGSTAGFGAAVTPSPVDGTTRVLTETMFKDVIQQAFTNGGNLKKFIAPPALKQAISGFAGNATKYVDAKDKTLTAGIDVYVSDFGRHEIIPHRTMRTRTVIGFDPELWAIATAPGRNFKPIDLPKNNDGDRKAVLTEWTLVSKNERGNAKIADLKAA
ncbi:SU10 major capsid protein [Methylorubrum thiocyanatum]|uniref:SU10 major capsid protein n=1 Tax=Methylorubrum thiocyanatum TaxID=47958 RepID=UPI003F8062A2